MALTNAWKYKALVRVNYSNIDTDLTGFPFVLSYLNLPAAMLDADGPVPCKSDGSDIRLATDALGQNEIPVEIAYCSLDNNPANSRIEVWAKGNVTTGAYTYFWIFWGNPDATEPSPSSTYGWYNVWDSNYAAVIHLADSVLIDSTSNGYSGTNSGSTVDTTKTCIGVSSRAFNRESAQYIDYGNILNINGSVDMTLEIVMRLTALASDQQYGFVGKGDHQYHMGRNNSGGNTEGMVVFSSPDWKVSHLNADPSLNTWFHIAGRRDNYNGLINCMLNGVLQSEQVLCGAISSSANDFVIGTNGEFKTTRSMSGYVEEVRVSTTYRSNAWLKATQAAILNPATFITCSEPQPYNGGTDRALLRGIARGILKGVL